jgi:hypothetical protein
MTVRKDTMKTYILRDSNAVEPQNPVRREPATIAIVDAICGPAKTTSSTPINHVLFIGLDVHNDSIAVSLTPGDFTEVRRYGIIGAAAALSFGVNAFLSTNSSTEGSLPDKKVTPQ